MRVVLVVGAVFAVATLVLGSISLYAVIQAGRTTGNLHAGNISNFDAFGVAAILCKVMAWLCFLGVTAWSNMDRTYQSQ